AAVTEADTIREASMATVTANAVNYYMLAQTPIAAGTQGAQAAATTEAELQATIAAGSDALATAQAQVNSSIGGALAAHSQLALQDIRNYPQALLLGVQSSTYSGGDRPGSALWTALDERPEIAGFLDGHSDSVYAIAYSPDGKLLASAGGEGSIFLWDTATRARTGLTLSEHSGSVFALAFSPDSKLLASAGSDGQILIWDVTTGARKEPRLSGHTATVEALAFNADGTILASAGEDATIRLWDVSTGKQIGDNLYGSGGGLYYSLALSPDGSALAAGLQDGTVQLWSVAEQTLARTFTGEHYQAVYSLAFSPDGKSLASAGFDQKVVVWNVRDGTTRFDPIYDSAGVTSVQFSPDGKQLLTVGAQVTLTDLGGDFPTTLKTLSLPELYLYKAIYSPDGETIAVTAGTNVILWQPDAVGRFSMKLDEQSEAVRGVAFSPDGTKLVSASQDGSLTLWDSATGETVWRYDDPNFSGWLSASFNPDGTKLVAGNEDGNLYIFGVAEGLPLQTLSGHSNWVMSVAYSPDGTKIASGSSDSSVRLWDAETGDPIGDPLTGQTGDIWSVAFSPDGKALASASNDTTISLWDVETGDPIGEPLPGHLNSIYVLAFSPDCKLLASGSRDMTAILCDTETWAQVAQLAGGHSDSIFGVAFSPDGETLASGSADGTITLWDTATYKAVSQPFATEVDWVNSLAFSPDGQSLAAGVGGSDYLAHETALFRLEAQNVSETGCRIAGRNMTWDEWTRFVGDVPYQRTCAEWPVHYSVIEALGREANVALTRGDSDAARDLYAQAAEWAVGSGAAGSSNDVCWFGSLNGFAEIVMPACEYAAENAPANANYLDSRGLARALTGDAEGAIADFQAFVDWTQVYGNYDTLGTQRLTWITRLTAGDDPFDEATLAELKAQ
ncbi:MAG: WD40 repeat domain-containing protein, partial [Anaerolineae bacterium]|nr:WD40 repeat domain-containing protein [Anaerolineae bacterium]